MKKKEEEEHFSQRLEKICEEKKSCLFLGLDPQTENIPKCFYTERVLAKKNKNEQYGELWYEYCSFCIETLNSVTAGIKLQSAYFETLGEVGIKTMRRLAEKAKKKNLLVLFDGKRSDIPSTALAYAKAYLGDPENDENNQQSYWKNLIDGMTINPFFGMDSIIPFLETAIKMKKGIFICLKTSNPGSIQIQNLMIKNEPLYIFLAKKICNLIKKNPLLKENLASLGFVVGGTFPKQAKEIRILLDKSPFLVPGFGAQKANLQDCKKFHFNTKKEEKKVYRGAIYPLSRGLIYPWLFNKEVDKNFCEHSNREKVSELLKETAEKYRNKIGL